MMAPPNTFAPAAVSPSSKLVRMGDMREKDSRRSGFSHQPSVVSQPRNCAGSLMTPARIRDMRYWLQLIGWLACVVYSTIPAFWLMIHPFAGRWRARRRSPYVVLLPAWVAMWIGLALITRPWRGVFLYRADWPWAAAVLLFASGLYLYRQSAKNFSAKQLGGLPEI